MSDVVERNQIDIPVADLLDLAEDVVRLGNDKQELVRR
jgi:hypothetical protein